MKQSEQIIGRGVGHSLEETAAYLGITRQRVQQIEQSAFRKIRRILKERYGITCALDLL